MSGDRVYMDSWGNIKTLGQMVRQDPEWAMERIKACERAEDALLAIKDWDVSNMMKKSRFTLPQRLRLMIQKALGQSVKSISTNAEESQCRRTQFVAGILPES